MTYFSGSLQRFAHSPQRATSLTIVSRRSVSMTGSVVPFAREASMASPSASKTMCVARRHSLGVSPLIASMTSHNTKKRARKAGAADREFMPRPGQAYLTVETTAIGRNTYRAICTVNADKFLDAGIPGQVRA